METSNLQPWYLNKQFHKFFYTVLQMIVLIIIILASICDMSFNKEADKTVWATLLSACMGYMLPGPNFKNLARNGIVNGNSNGNSPEYFDEVDGKKAEVWKKN